MLSIDLHGYSVQDTIKAVRKSFQMAIEQGLTEIYFVTGYGSHVNANGSSGVLKKMLPKLFDPFKESILKIDKENAAYKITLKKNLSLKEQESKAFEKTDFFKTLLASIKIEADAGDRESQFYMAAYYLHSEPTDADEVSKAIKTLEHLESMGMIEAGELLARTLLQSTRVARNPKKAIQILEKYKNQSNNAKFDLAKVLLQGEGIIKDEVRGKELMLELAQLNYAAACCTLGQSYLKGDYTEKDDALGVKYLQRAAVQNFSAAFVDLARCYGAGQGIKQNNELALLYYRKSAEFNNPYAVYQLGRYYSIGKGVVQSKETAFKYFLRAAQLGDGDAQIEVAVIYIMGWGVAIDKNQGIQWLKKAAEQQHAEACYLLGCILIEGQLMQKDVNAGMKHLRVAIKNEHPLAMLSLALTILANTHTETEKKQAFDLLEKAYPMTAEVTPLNVRVYLVKWHYDVARIFFAVSKSISAKMNEPAIIQEALLSLAVIFTKPEDNKITLGLLLAEYAAQSGHADAQWFLVKAYLLNEIKNLAQDGPKGLVYLSKLVEKHDPDALYLLATAFARGNFGLGVDLETSYNFTLMAAHMGSEEAKSFLLFAQELKEKNSAQKQKNKAVTPEPSAVPIVPVTPATPVTPVTSRTAKPIFSKYAFAAAGIGFLGVASAITYKFFTKN